MRIPAGPEIRGDVDVNLAILQTRMTSTRLPGWVPAVLGRPLVCEPYGHAAKLALSRDKVVALSRNSSEAAR